MFAQSIPSKQRFLIAKSLALENALISVIIYYFFTVVGLNWVK